MEMRQANRGEMNMPSKTNSKPPKASKTSISSEKSMEKKPLEQKQNVEKEKKVGEKASDKTNSIEFNARLWENLYYLYKSEISGTNIKLYQTINDLEILLKTIPGLVSVLVLFKKIVPSIQENDRLPFYLLYRAIKDVQEKQDFNFMCIFVQIATTRFNELKTFAINYMNSQKGHEGNKFSINSINKRKKEEAEVLIPLFYTIIREKRDFNEAYDSVILPALLDNKTNLIKTIGKLTKGGKKSKKDKERNDAIKQAIESLVRLNNIEVDQQNAPDKQLEQLKEKEKKEVSNFIIAAKKIDTLKKRIYDQYNRIRTTPMEEYSIVFPKIGPVPLQMVHNIFWKKLDVWPIENRLKECLFEYSLEEYDCAADINKVKRFKEHLKTKDKDVNRSVS